MRLVIGTGMLAVVALATVGSDDTNDSGQNLRRLDVIVVDLTDHLARFPSSDGSFAVAISVTDTDLRQGEVMTYEGQTDARLEVVMPRRGSKHYNVTGWIPILGGPALDMGTVTLTVRPTDEGQGCEACRFAVARVTRSGQLTPSDSPRDAPLAREQASLAQGLPGPNARLAAQLDAMGVAPLPAWLDADARAGKH